MESQGSFGNWLRRMRKAKDWTQADLGHLIGCTAATIRKIEAEERFPSKQITWKLADLFGISPQDREQFQKYARGYAHVDVIEPAEIAKGLNTRLAHRSNLPWPTTSLVGRDQAIDDLRRYLLDPTVRLVTLVGPPGIGKTRLSIAAARDIQATFEDGVFFIPLNRLEGSSGSESLIDILALQILEYVETYSLSTRQQLASGIREKKMLLVLDNCEHLIANAAEFASELLTACPNLKFLATSRETLRVNGEWVYPVPPLQLPPQTTVPDIEDDVSLLANYPALELYAERARAVRADFTLNKGNIYAVATLCTRVDCLPLGIELIAAQARWMPPQVMLYRINDQWIMTDNGRRVDDPRQKNLYNAIDWSFSLLSPEEQRLFAHLSVFLGGFSLQAAESLMDHLFAGQERNELVASLVEKSLIQPTSRSGTEVRFSMLRTIHEYASMRLSDMGQANAARDWHLAYFLDLVEQADQHIHGKDQLEWMDRVEQESDNISAALTWSITEQKSHLAFRLLGGVIWAWHERGHFHELQEFFAQVHQLPVDVHRKNLPYARLLKNMGFLQWLNTDTSSAQFLLTESQRISEALGVEGERNLAETLHWLGLNALTATHDAELAKSFIWNELQIWEKWQDGWGIANSILALGVIESSFGHFDAAQAYLKQSLEMLREIGDELLISRVYLFLQFTSLKQGDDAVALQFFDPWVEICERHQSWTYIALDQRNLGFHYHVRGNYEQANLLYEKSLTVSEEHGIDLFEGLLLYGMLALQWGNALEAARRFRKLLNLVWKSQEREGICFPLAGIASAAVKTNQVERAVVLFGAIQTLPGYSMDQSIYFQRPDFETYLQSARHQLGKEEFTALIEKGKAMTVEHAVAFSLDTFFK